FSPDGTALVTGSRDQTIRFWEPATGKQIAQLAAESTRVGDLAFLPDGRQFVTGGGRRPLRGWDFKDRKLLATLREDPVPDRGTSSALLTMAVSPDGKLAATGSESGAIQVRDAQTGAVRHTLTGHEDAVTALAFSGDGKYLASG